MENQNLCDMRDAWIGRNFSVQNKKLPVSFEYGGAPCPLPLFSFEGKAEGGTIDFTAKDPKTGLCVRVSGRIYEDYPALEWTAYLKNESNKPTENTPVLAHIRAIEARFAAAGEPAFRLSTNRGDICTASSYEPLEKWLRYGDSAHFSPVGGRPTSDALPFFGVSWDNCGVLMGLGWPGQWCAEFHSDKEGELNIAAGQEITRMSLCPGEEIRTPLVVLMFCGGDLTEAQNMWRGWMLAHNMQKAAGQKIEPFSSVCRGLTLTEKVDLDAIDEIKNNGIGIDYYWTDAGWYVSEGSWTQTGTWRSDPVRYPRTYRAVSDHAHKNGMKTVLWLEAERVSPGSELAGFEDWLLVLPEDKKSYRSDRMYPEYFLKNGQFATMESHRNQLVGGDALFNLGDDAAREYLTNLIAGIIEDYDIDCYRTDFNIAPLEFWLSADGENRHGMTENKYVTGLLKFWDDLQGRFPEVVFDTCSSGGRRNDLETLRRALPLLRSDFQVGSQCATGNQGHTYGLSGWIPFAGTGCPSDDTYLYRSHLCPFMGIGRSGDMAKWKKAAEDWKAVRMHFLGDYYPLTEYSLSEEKWIAWQFHTPETGSGMVQVFRRSNCSENTLNLKLKALDPDAEYELKNFDEGAPSRRSGRELMDVGLDIALKDAPGSAIIVYKKI